MSLPIQAQLFNHFPAYEAPAEGEPIVDPKKKIEPGCYAKCNLEVQDYQVCFYNLFNVISIELRQTSSRPH